MENTDNLTFDYLQLQLTFESRGLLKFPDFAGSMVRGAFGASLKRTYCRQPGACKAFCRSGMLCTYGRLFETPLDKPHELLGDVKHAPHPFAIHAPSGGHTLLEPGQSFEVDWTVWGEGLRELHYSIIAWKQAGETGFGVDRTPAELIAVKRRDNGEIVFSMDRPAFGNLDPVEFSLSLTDTLTDVTIKTLSPLRVKSDRSYFGLHSRGDFELRGEVFFTALSRRLRTCIGFVGPDVSMTQPHVTASRFHWKDNTRYSSRQRSSMEMGGIMGELMLSGVDGRHYAMLRAGEILQIGKNTSMGLGKYIVEEF